MKKSKTAIAVIVFLSGVIVVMTIIMVKMAKFMESIEEDRLEIVDVEKIDKGLKELKAINAIKYNYNFGEVLREENRMSEEEKNVDEEENMDKERVKARKSIDFLESVLEKEGINRKRSIEITGKATETLDTAEYKGTSLKEVRCSNSICKVVIEHDSEDARQVFLEKGIFEKPWNTHQVGTIDVGNGLIQTHIYFSKEGEILPTMKKSKKELESQT